MVKMCSIGLLSWHHSGSLITMQFPGPDPDLSNQNLQRWDPGIYILNKLPRSACSFTYGYLLLCDRRHSRHGSVMVRQTHNIPPLKTLTF